MEKKFNIVLDLDNTLIHSIEYNEYIKNIKKYNKIQIPYLMDKDFAVFKRPNLDIFLDYIFENYNVSIWTAASRSYALDIVKNIIKPNKNRKIHYIFFSYHCDISEKQYTHQKNLNLLFDFFGISKDSQEKTFILDDYDHIYKIQKKYCLLASPFNISLSKQKKDDFLLDIITQLKEIKQKGNISSINFYNTQNSEKYKYELPK